MAQEVSQDIELGQSGTLRSSDAHWPTHVNGRTRRSIWSKCLVPMNGFSRFLAKQTSTFAVFIASSIHIDSPAVKDLPQIEDYPDGYPRFSALIASHDSFLIARRFSNLRARLLLLKQTHLAGLEHQLHKIDKEEDRPMFLASAQRDKNTARQATVTEINKALEDYDNFVLRSNRVLSLEDTSSNAVVNLQNWVNAKGCISWLDTDYLEQAPEELLSIRPQDESTMIGLQSKVAEKLLRLRDFFFKSYRPRISRDQQIIYLPNKSAAAFVSRALMTPIIVAMLLGPVILCSYLHTTSSQLFAIAGATISFIAITSATTKMKSSELIVAGATYATVLVVFLSES